MGNETSAFRKLDDDGGENFVTSNNPIRPSGIAEPMFEGKVKGGGTCNIKAITKYTYDARETTICWMHIKANDLVVYDSIKSKKRKTFVTWPLGGWEKKGDQECCAAARCARS